MHKRHERVRQLRRLWRLPDTAVCAHSHEYIVECIERRDDISSVARMGDQLDKNCNRIAAKKTQNAEHGKRQQRSTASPVPNTDHDDGEECGGVESRQEQCMTAHVSPWCNDER